MFRIALQWFRDYYRDGSALFFGLIFPLLMTACLGNLLADLDAPDTQIEGLKIGYCVEGGADAEGVLDPFTEALGGVDGVELARVDGERAAKRSVDDRKTDAALLFDENLDVTVYEGADRVKNRAAVMIAKGYARESAAYGAVYQAFADDDPQEVNALTERLFALSGAQEALVADKDYGGRTQSMIDFYAVTMIVMICFMGNGIGGAVGMYLLRSQGLLRRLTVSPRRGATVFLESVLGSAPGAMLQTLAVMIPSVLFLGAHYAPDIGGNILLFAFFTLLGTTVSAVFMLIGLFAKVSPYMIVMVILWTMLFLSGSFNRTVSIPGVGEYLPMSIANRAAFDLTMFGQTGPMLTLMAALALILAVSCLAGSVLMKRKDVAL
jgi:ABC-type multidrug transport system permease subunit